MGPRDKVQNKADKGRTKSGKGSKSKTGKTTKQGGGDDEGRRRRATETSGTVWNNSSSVDGPGDMGEMGFQGRRLETSRDFPVHSDVKALLDRFTGIDFRVHVG